MIKNSFFILLFLFFLSFNNIFAADYTIVDPNCSVQGECIQAGLFCNKGAPNECPVCSSGTNKCCSVAGAWTKNVVDSCYATGEWRVSPVYPYTNVWYAWCVITFSQSTSQVCSTADKYNSADPRLLRYGNCNCSAGGIYKACCRNGQLINAVLSPSEDDGIDPPEANCPAGTMIWNGGNAITLAWAQNKCCPVVNGTSGQCGGSNGGSTCDAPTSLCASGTLVWDDSSGGDGGFNWHCTGTAGSCGGSSGSTDWCSSTHIADVTGVCGSSNGGNFSSAPSTNLCSSGSATWTDSIGADRTFNWNCPGVCYGSSASCSAIKNSPPVFNALVVKNSTSNVVSTDTGNKNQICDTDFNKNRTVTFEISASDADGIADITNMTLTWNGTTIPRLSAIGATTVFGASFDNSFNNPSTLPLVVTITDSKGQTDTDNSRLFKFWDCKVPVSGTIYDGSAGLVCPTIGFTLPADINVNLKSLSFRQNSTDLNMTINANGISYTSGANPLTWGTDSYIPNFNSDIGLDPSTVKMRLLKSPIGSSTCNFYIDTTVNVDPYVASPSLTADFSAVLDQDPWWQSANGGAFSNTEIKDKVPVTCVNCKISSNALVSSPFFNKTVGRNISDIQTNYYTGAIANVTNNYYYFRSQYLDKKGVGVTLVGDQNISAIGSEGIYFIDGNLNITSNKVLTPNTFLMLIVKDNIIIDPSVTQVDGILVANNISAGGTSPSQLVFNGSLFALDTVNLSRGYTNKRINNTSPAVVVNYNPELLFKIPGAITKSLNRWQWGN